MGQVWLPFPFDVLACVGCALLTVGAMVLVWVVVTWDTPPPPRPQVSDEEWARFEEWRRRQ